MGIRGLFRYCNPIRKHANMNENGLHIGLDGFSLLYLFKEDRSAFEEYLKKLVSVAKSIDFVMDKRAAKEKRDVVEERKELRKEAKAEAKSLSTFVQSSDFEDLEPKQQEMLEKLIAQRERAAWHLYPEYITWLTNILENYKIALVKAPEEADIVLAKGGYDVVISSDSDLLILGAKRLWIPRGVGIQHNEINGEDFIKYIGINGERLFELAYLAGCDVQPKSHMTVAEAVSRLRFYGSLCGIHKKHPEIVSANNISEYKVLKESVWSL
jgi:5'-3' exonuclease